MGWFCSVRTQAGWQEGHRRPETQAGRALDSVLQGLHEGTRVPSLAYSWAPQWCPLCPRSPLSTRSQSQRLKAELDLPSTESLCPLEAVIGNRPQLSCRAGRCPGSLESLWVWVNISLPAPVGQIQVKVWGAGIQTAPDLKWFGLCIFTFTMVQKQYASSRNYILNFEF